MKTHRFSPFVSLVLACAFIFILPLSSGCAPKQLSRTEYLMDTVVSVKLFDFSDTVTIVSPVVKVLSIRASKSGLEYRLPVVIENGSIQAYISDVVCTGGTMLNERMQDFLMAVDEYSTACENKQTEQIKSGFADLLKKYIEINDDNAVGEYIRTAYRSSL